MNKKISSFFLLMLSHAIFDTLIKKETAFSVNLDILYHGSWFAFVLFWWYIAFTEARFKIDKSILIIILMYILMRLSLNLLSINKSYEQYSNLVSNQYIDTFTWLALVIVLTFRLCIN